MKFDVKFSFVLFIYLFLTGCGFYPAHLPGKLPETEPLSDDLTLTALDEWADSLAGIEKILNGEMTHVTLIDPVYVVTPGKKKEMDEIGFGMVPRDDMYSTEYKFETPLDKCTWLSAFIGYPLEFKLNITPGIKYSATSHMHSYEKVGSGRYRNPNSPDQRTFPSGDLEVLAPAGYIIDDLDAWKTNTEPYLGLYGKPIEDNSSLCIEVAIELPEGDSWLNNMNTSFKDNDKFIFHLKAYRKDDPGNIPYGTMEVRYKDILPFLTELASTIASVQGFHEIGDEQKGWLANEPVTNINAWGEFLEAYAKRTWEYVDCFPADTKSGRYLNKLYTALNGSDPGNTVSLLSGGSGASWTLDSKSQCSWVLKHKPYLPFIYESLKNFRQMELVTKGGLYNASELWIQAVKARPDIAKFHICNAGVLLKKGKYDAAVGEFNTGVRIEPDAAYISSWHNLRMWGGRLQGDIDLDTETQFSEMVVDKFPDASSERDYLATLYQRRGEDDKAFEQYDQSKDLNVGRNLGMEYAKKGMNEKAIAIYEKLVVDHAKYGHNWLELADLYAIVGNDEKELWALEGFLENISLENTGWPSYLPDVNARISGLKGDVSGQIRNLLVEYPFMYSADERYLDFAEALYGEGYLNDAFFLVYMVLAQLDSHRQRMSEKEMQLYERAMTLREKYLKEFWPEFDASKALVSQPYPGPYAEAKVMKRSDGIRVAVLEYRRLLDEYPSLIEVREYRMMIEQIYKDDLEVILEAKLMEVLVSEAVDETGTGHGHSARSGFRNWGDRYERYLKEKLEGLYGIAG